MPILARLTNFCDFHDSASLGISKISTVNFEIPSFSCHLFKNFCFPVTQVRAPGKLSSGYKLKDFSTILN